jgi:hypothetical protein
MEYERVNHALQVLFIDACDGIKLTSLRYAASKISEQSRSSSTNWLILLQEVETFQGAIERAANLVEDGGRA